MIAVVIVNFKRASDTLECLESLLRVNTPAFHIFLIDNGSGPEDRRRLQSYALSVCERITFIAYPENYGFTGAHNRIFERLLTTERFDYILLLNNDTVVTPEFLERMLQRIDRRQGIEMVAARMMQYANPQQVDNLGITFYKSGLASNRKAPDHPLLGPCGGCALYTATLLERLRRETGEYFDAEFFCYAEDTDLAWRAVLLGYRAAYAGDALVYHKGSLSSGGANSDFIVYHGIRNSLFVLLKNVPAGLILRNLGWIALMQLAIVLRYTAKAKLALVCRLYWDFGKRIPLMLRKRRYCLRHRILSRDELKALINFCFYEKGYTQGALFELFGLKRRS